ncbi:DUF5000 domain-containing lipoprotein [Pararcticibacter amylolyticus]|uniref:DUF4959 domain-containing protein n=1 Tax=Pararcticibacter amylolyticus TaxID=2173175 RepID=A0A2U2PDA9_9SPHI|nr:DUF5000 domain-containing lipoprotein [Pararcticibacter amylolyticus]PWG79378.1 hypothetical protein DDR33_17850 [Pararcticibacter amylolyticus]
MKAILKIYQLVLIVLLLSFSACKDALEPEPIRKGGIPGVVENFSSKEIPGGAIITYDVPEGSDLRYVKASYILSDGMERESKSTVYKNTITVEGFAKAGEYDVSLTAVSVGEVESKPVTVRVTVGTPPHLLVAASLANDDNFYATFGGINADYVNSAEGNVVIRVMIKDAHDKWQEINAEYTRAKKGRVRVRGLDTVEYTFGIYVRDRWNNKSDTIVKKLVPLFEREFDKALFRHIKLPGDTWERHTGQGRSAELPVLWNGLHNQNGSIFQTKPSTVIPQHFTWDMGVKARLSRFIFYPDIPPSERNVYTGGQPSVWELWGSNNPNPDGTFDASWTLVGTFHATKPSGLPLGQLSTDDIALARKGEDFEVEGKVEAFRYWRWRTIANWGNVTYVAMSEFTFFGAVEE